MGGISSKPRNTGVTGAGGGAGATAGSHTTVSDTTTKTAVKASSKQHFIPRNQVLSKHLASFLGTAELSVFSQLNKTCHADAKPELDKRAALRLLEHTVKGEEKRAQAMLAANPSLILISGAKTVDYSGKLITGLTAFQVALCAGDADMVKMMLPYFDKLADGSHQLAEQINAVFPEGYDTHLHAQAEATFNFDTIFNTIAHASNDDIQIALSLSGASFEQSGAARSKDDSDLTLTEAMNRFRELFSQKSLSETIYNPQHLLKALALYNATFEPANRGQWSWDRRDLFRRQIIGFCQRFVPACTAQAFAQGIYYLVKVPEYQPESWLAEHFNRSLKFRHGGGPIYPIRAHCSGLGFSYAAGVVWSFSSRTPIVVHFSKNLFQSSQQAFAGLCQEALPQHGMHALNNAR